MRRYKVTMSAELVFEVDATTDYEAIAAFTTHFHKVNAIDPLQGTRFTFKSGWRNAANPRLMTTSWLDWSGVKAELL